MQPLVCGICGVGGKHLVAVAGRAERFYICTSCYFNYFMEPGIPASDVLESRKREPFITVPS